VPQVEVSFDIDANGILNVTAKDMGTGKEQAIKITAKSGLSEQEIKNMVKDAELHAEEDKARKERVTIANELDSMAYQTEKLIKENDASFQDADKKSATEVIAEARKELANKDSKAADLKAIYERLQNMTHKLSSDLYAKNQGGGAQPDASAGAADSGGDAGGATKGGNDVIDADYKDVR
jgi:molecular chaperone DnaK